MIGAKRVNIIYCRATPYRRSAVISALHPPLLISRLRCSFLFDKTKNTRLSARGSLAPACCKHGARQRRRESRAKRLDLLRFLQVRFPCTCEPRLFFDRNECVFLSGCRRKWFPHPLRKLSKGNLQDKSSPGPTIPAHPPLKKTSSENRIKVRIIHLRNSKCLVASSQDVNSHIWLYGNHQSQ